MTQVEHFGSRAQCIKLLQETLRDNLILNKKTGFIGKETWMK
jgi:hypothetical protein